LEVFQAPAQRIQRKLSDGIKLLVSNRIFKKTKFFFTPAIDSRSNAIRIRSCFLMELSVIILYR
jgi:hypothetical protein